MKVTLKAARFIHASLCESLRNLHLRNLCILQSVAESYNDLQVLCSVDRMEKSVKSDKDAQKAFDQIKKRLQNVLKELIRAYEKRLKQKSAQIAKKNKKIRGLQADIKVLKKKLAFSKSKAKEIIKKINQ